MLKDVHEILDYMLVVRITNIIEKKWQEILVGMEHISKYY